MSTKRLETVSDCIRHDLDLQAKCPCGRTEVIEPSELMAVLIKRQASGRFEDVAKMMVCKRCKRKECKLTPVPRF